MSILIDGFRMPKKKNGFVVVIYPDGVCACEDGRIFDAVELPPHGRLIDADAAIANRNSEGNWFYDLSDLPDYLADCPTIIEAEGEDDG